MGAGGDRTMELDRAAEATVLGELQGIADRGEAFSVLSEEVGMRSFGAPFPLVVVDPVDGSLNAKQGIPFYNVMLAVLDGPTVGEASVGCVVNLVSGEAWTAIRGHGAKRNGRAIEVIPRERRDRIQLLGLESSTRSLGVAQRLVERSSKVRILGSMALSMAHTAAGALDAFCAPVPMRVFDMTAGLLIIREAGGVATDVQGRSIDSLECALTTRTTLLCAPDAEAHALALRAFLSD
ncbi:MAG TPA: inositol monophosphatase [Candidatus Dormibacteraeota bacterium]|nr:inositol monophosphatase [Candidatus Dormibacteraeota bacterium]